mgnify:CR=1 FL=1
MALVRSATYVDSMTQLPSTSLKQRPRLQGRRVSTDQIPTIAHRASRPVSPANSFLHPPPPLVYPVHTTYRSNFAYVQLFVIKILHLLILSTFEIGSCPLSEVFLLSVGLSHLFTAVGQPR